MTNKSAWESYTSGLPSPANYITWGYRYLVSASLQRRVWMPPEHRPLYPNLYVVLVGEPGIGKGQVIKSVEAILRFHKMESNVVKEYSNAKEHELAVMVAEQDLKQAQELESENVGKNKQNIEKPLLIPIAANAITYEALVYHMSQSLRRIEYVNEEGKLKLYSHSSLCFCLEELASLMRSNKNTKDIVNFLHETYDCNDNYEYSTKTQGKSRIKRTCLNLLGGTTPDFMQETFNDGILNQGFSSRTFFVYAERNRKSVFFIPELTDVQKSAQNQVIDHVKGLTKLYGQVIIDQDTKDYLEKWWHKYSFDTSARASSSRKLKAYYSRKVVHVMKVAACEHFGETYDMFVPKQRFIEAIEYLHDEEKTMHLALTMESDNPLANTSAMIMTYLRLHGRQTIDSLLVEFWGRVRRTELEEIMNFLQSTDQVTVVQDKDPDTERVDFYYQPIS